MVSPTKVNSYDETSYHPSSNTSQRTSNSKEVEKANQKYHEIKQRYYDTKFDDTRYNKDNPSALEEYLDRMELRKSEGCFFVCTVIAIFAFVFGYHARQFT